MSSRVGSMADNLPAVRTVTASKAALSSMGKSLAMDLKSKGVVVLLLHPGYVISGLDKTDETKNNPQAAMPDEAARKLWKVVQSKRIAETGTFWHREGFELPC